MRTRMRVAVLCSHRAPGLVHLLNHDPRGGRDYDIVCCLTSSDTFAEEVRVERRVPCIAHSIRRFCREHGSELRDLEARIHYDWRTLDLLDSFHPDLVILDGYLLLLTAPMLERFESRIVNIHHSDLFLRNGQGGPRYPGLRAVRDALFAGENETRASAHIVTEQLDNGPVILRSWSYPVAPMARWAHDHGAADVLRSCAWAHQEWMLRTAWGPMLAGSIELAAGVFRREGRPLDLGSVMPSRLMGDGALVADGAFEEDEDPGWEEVPLDSLEPVGDPA